MITKSVAAVLPRGSAGAGSKNKSVSNQDQRISDFRCGLRFRVRLGVGI